METRVADRERDAADARREQFAKEFAKNLLKLPVEQRKEVMTLLAHLGNAKSEAEAQEIFMTVGEILMPEKMLGRLVIGGPLHRRSDGKFLAGRAEYIGTLIRQFREKKGWTQTQLANASGLPQSHISRLEIGRHSPSNVTLKKVAKALGVPVTKIDYADDHE